MEKRGTCRASNVPHQRSNYCDDFVETGTPPCRACYGPSCMQTESGRAYCSEHSIGRVVANVTDHVIDGLRKALLAAESLAEERRSLAQQYRERMEAVEQERDAMALALARKEIAK